MTLGRWAEFEVFPIRIRLNFRFGTLLRNIGYATAQWTHFGGERARVSRMRIEASNRPARWFTEGCHLESRIERVRVDFLAGGPRRSAHTQHRTVAREVGEGREEPREQRKQMAGRGGRGGRGSGGMGSRGESAALGSMGSRWQGEEEGREEPRERRNPKLWD